MSRSDESYMAAVRKEFVARALDFEPDMILHSLGHDTCMRDYGDRGLTEDFFPRLAAEVKACAQSICSGKTRRLLQGVKVRETVTVDKERNPVAERYIEYKLPDRQRARIELGKRIGFYPAEKIDATRAVTTTVTLTEENRQLAREMVAAWRRKLIEEGEEEI